MISLPSARRFSLLAQTWRPLRRRCLWKNHVTFAVDPSPFTFVQHREPVHVRYAGASEMQVNVGATVSNTDVVFRHPVRGRVVATLVPQE